MDFLGKVDQSIGAGSKQNVLDGVMADLSCIGRVGMIIEQPSRSVIFL